MAEGRSDPQPGDLIEIDRPGYQHWALYVGNGYVIHVTDENAPSLSASKRAILTRRAEVIKKQLLKDVVENHNWRVNNKYDHSFTPRPVEDIIWSAEQWIYKELPYDVLTSNCEHFMTMLRYGKGVSDQSRTSAGCEIPIRDTTDEKDCPNPGDLIEIKKGSYAQWALYVGDGYVIHMTPVDENAAPLSASGVTIPISKVKAAKELLKEVVGKDDWAVNNKYDLYHTPLPVEEIIGRAEYYIGKVLPYDELGIYSEDFVTDLRYGLLVPGVPLRNTKSDISSFKMTKPRFGHPSPGDLIEIYRLGYQHWALYMGDGYVIHVNRGGCSSSSSGSSVRRTTEMATLKKELLKKVVENCKWSVHNKYDLDCSPRPIREIIQSAQQWIGKKWQYKLLHNNCEHFVTMLRYGERISNQGVKVRNKWDEVKSVPFLVLSVAMNPATFLTALSFNILTGIACYMIKSKRRKNNLRNQI